MDSRRKRALLGRIDGQLAAMERAAGSPLRWQRIQRAVQALRKLPGDERERRYLRHLQQHLSASIRGLAGHAIPALLLHHRTLARADCVAWQLYLRRRSAAAGSRPRPAISR